MERSFTHAIVSTENLAREMEMRLLVTICLCTLPVKLWEEFLFECVGENVYSSYEGFSWSGVLYVYCNIFRSFFLSFPCCKRIRSQILLM